MDSLKDLGARDVVQALQDYYGYSMLEQANKPMPFFTGQHSTVRDEAYYAKHEPLNPETHCVHCGHSLEDPDY